MVYKIARLLFEDEILQILKKFCLKKGDQEMSPGSGKCQRSVRHAVQVEEGAVGVLCGLGRVYSDA